MKKIRLGLIGAGWMGKAHSNAFLASQTLFGEEQGAVEFEIVADLNQESAKKLANTVGFKKYTTDWQEVVKDPNIDLIDITTPNASHYEIAKQALLNGKHVYCEKPLSISAIESAELVKLAKQQNVINYIAYNNVMNPANAYVFDLIKNNKLGKIIRFTGTYDQDQLLDPDLPISWRHITKLAGGAGSLGDLGSHLLSISQFLMGNIVKVNAQATKVFPERPKLKGSTEMLPVENEDMMAIIASYENGASGIISCSRVATGRKNYLAYEIQGTKGTVSYNLERMGEVNVYFQSDEERDRGFRKVLLNPHHKGYGALQPAGGIAIAYNDMKILEIHELFNAILKDEEYVCNFEFGYQIDKVVDSVLESAKKNMWVNVK